MSLDCSIIIVNYNTRELLLACLESIYQTADEKYKFEIIVVDNASQDGSIEAVKSSYPDVILAEQPYNLGFAKANNKGIALAQGSYILLLNSDTVVQEGCLATMLDFMEENKQVGAAGCKIVLTDGSLDKACKRSFPTPANALFHYLGFPKLFPNNRKFGAYNLTYLGEDEINEVDSLVGAFMLVRREAIDQVGALSEDYFMYAEDIDWCYRIKEAGWKIVYYPKARIIHSKRASSKKTKLKTTYYFYKSMLIFYNKFYRQKYGFLVMLLTYIGIGFIFLITELRGIITVCLNWMRPQKA